MKKKNIITLILISLILSLLCSCATTTKTPKANSQQIRMATATKELGEAYMAQGDYTAALNEFIKAEKITPSDPYLHNDLGLTYMAKKRFDLAEEHFKKAIELNPDYIPAKNNLGSSYLKQQKWDLAIACFQEISGNLLYATPHYPLSNLGWAYLGKKDLALAKKYFLMALESQPDFLNAIHGLAITYIESFELKSAFQIINKGIEKEKNLGSGGVAILYADLARVYEKNRQFDKAKESWQKVIDLAPIDSGLTQEANDKIHQL